jgi:nucleotidyltransferase/DNA polymerase involved in DNA repair
MGNDNNDKSDNHSLHGHERIICHFDLDAFYVACERELNPSALLGVPVAVSQYNPYGELRETSSEEVDRRLIVRPGGGGGGGQPVVDNGDANGSLIAVSYEARAASVRRNDRGRDAVKKCPDLCIVQVPVRHGKADLTMYRDASYRVLNKLVSSIKENPLLITTNEGDAASKIRVEKASIDEIYIDLTPAANAMAERVINERERLANKDSSTRSNSKHSENDEGYYYNNYWQEILSSSGVACCTTVGGVEDANENARAANALSKDELRRGSRWQVLDSSSESGGDATTDQGSRAWWQRDLRIEWTDMEIRLACGAALASRARSDVTSFFATAKANDDGTTTGNNNKRGEIFTLSAGISSNKTLAKLASGLKKPNRQTLVDPTNPDSLRKLFHPLPIGRIRGLGGKLGAEVSEKLCASTVGDIAKLSLADIERHYPQSPEDETARFLFNISRGICTEEVSDRTTAKSIACSKTFRNHLALDPTNEAEMRRWTGELCEELAERLSLDRKDNHRTPKLFVVSVKLGKENHVSRSSQAPRAHERFTDEALKLIRQIVGSSSSKIEGLGMSASSFVEVADESSSILAAFSRVSAKSQEGSSPAARSVAQKKKVSKLGSLKTLWYQSHNGKDGSRESPGEAEIDPDILSQLPPSIRSELTLSSQQHECIPTTSIVGRPEKKSGMERWLVQNDGTGSSVTKERTKLYSAGESRSNTRLRWDDIDQETLMELPADIRDAVIRDMKVSTSNFERQAKKPKKGIASFFAPAK